MIGRIFARAGWLVAAYFAVTVAIPTAAMGQRGKDSPRGLEAFDITKEPRGADWRYFLRAAERDRARLWVYHARQGRRLKDWNWGWRLGWVRACAKSNRPLCRKILKAALKDKALVVRAEAASRFGDRFEGTGNQEVVRLLSEAYKDPRNSRSGKPLFVQNRILHALKRIGGDSAEGEAARLARSHPKMATYWKLINKG